MQETVGLFADTAIMPTGMATVAHNIALNLSLLDVRVLYFGRFGQEHGFSKEPVVHPHITRYSLIDCEGGVWHPRTMIEAINHYSVDTIIAMDDFFSAGGIVRASMKTCKDLHFISPIDSLPIHPRAHDIFSKCKKTYVPNSSYKLIKNGVYLPHGVDRMVFYPERIPRDDDLFTFLWVGRDEPRKGLGRAIMAFQKARKRVDCKMIVHSDWSAETGKRTARYLKATRLPVILSQMESGSQDSLRQTYNSCDALVVSSKAGACELSILESQACGVTPIVTDWTFMNEMVEDGVTGYKIPISSKCGDTTFLWNKKRWGIPLGRKWGNISISKLAEKMIWSVNNRDEVRRVGENGLRYVSQHHDWLDITRKLLREIQHEKMREV